MLYVLTQQKTEADCFVCSGSVCLSPDVSEQWVQSVGVPADHEAGGWLGEGDGVSYRSHPAAADLPHGDLFQHLRTTQRTLRGPSPVQLFDYMKLVLLAFLLNKTHSNSGFCLLQVFYWTHLSYIWVWILLIIHCANFWKWFVVPGLVFLLEKIVGNAVSRMGGLYIVEVNLLPSKVSRTILQQVPLSHYLFN